MKTKKRIFILFLLLIFFAAGCFSTYYFFLHTTKGGLVVSKTFLSSVISLEDFKFNKISGDISEKLTFDKIELKNLKFLPEGSTLFLQNLVLQLSSFSSEGFYAEVNNGRLKMPVSDPVLFYGNYKENLIDVNIFCKEINLREILDLLPEENRLERFRGTLTDVDLFVTGGMEELNIKGKITVEQGSFKDFTMASVPFILDLRLIKEAEEWRIYGDVAVESGSISAKRTKIVLLPGKVMFSGKPSEISFDLHGVSKIKNVTINVNLKGDRTKPVFNLTSDPPMSETKALIILATGQKWDATEAALQQSKVSPEVSSEFFDFLIFGGAGGNLAKLLGISEVHLKYDGKTQGATMKKQVNGKSEVLYDIEQTKTESMEKPTRTQRIGGKYDVNDNVSVEVEKRYKQDVDHKKSTETEEGERLMLKFKKTF